MLSQEELEDLYAENLTPLSDKELQKHLEHRELKSNFEFIHAHNFELIVSVKKWIAFFKGEGPKPSGTIYKELIPKHKGDNLACCRLDAIVAYYKQFDHGATPKLPIAHYTARSSLTLISLLAELHHAEHLEEAERQCLEFFALVMYQGPAKMTRKEFAAALDEAKNRFVEACVHNAKALSAYIIQQLNGNPNDQPATRGDVKSAAETISDAVMKGSAKVAKTLRKPKGRKPRSRIDVQEAVWNIHERLKDLQGVKDMHPRGIATRENEFLFGKRELKPHGIETVKAYINILRDRVKRHSNESCKRAK